MPISLSLVIDFYYWWASATHGIVRVEDREVVRREIHELARSQLKNSDDLGRILDPEQGFLVSQLVYPPGPANDNSAFVGVEHWRWLGGVLLDFLHRDPPVAVPEVGHLISQYRAGERIEIQIAEVIPERMTGLFGQRVQEVIRLIVESRDRVPDRHREIVDQVIRSFANLRLSGESVQEQANDPPN
jgi:hypothetical protein